MKDMEEQNMDTSALLHYLQLSDFVVNKNCEGISHRESLVQPQPDAHSFNWVLGHIIKIRNEVLESLGKVPVYSKNKFDVYTPKGFDAEKAMNVAELHDSFNALQTVLKETIQSLSEETLRKRASLTPDKDSGDTIGSILGTVLWHEAYHAGQLGIIRRVVGKPGMIKNPAGE
jgi:uncharacterized damage-inducible protein DinB